MADLDDARELALADIADAGAEAFEIGPRRVERRLGAGDDEAELARLDHLAVAADRRRQQMRAALFRRRAQLGRGLLRHRRAVDQDLGRLVLARQHALGAERHVEQILRRRDHGEHDVAVGEIDRRVDHRRAILRQRIGLGARAVIGRDLAAGLGEPRRHRKSHAAGADPAERVVTELHLSHPVSHPWNIRRRRGRMVHRYPEAFSIGLCNRLQGSADLEDFAARRNLCRPALPPHVPFSIAQPWRVPR